MTLFDHKGERKQFPGKKMNFKIFRVLNLENFSKNFPKLRSKFRNFITIVIKKLKFLTRFHSGLSVAIHWCLNWFLQNLANAFSSGEKICWERTIKIFSTIFLKKSFLTGFYQKSTIIDPPYFLASEHVNTCQKLSILEKKSEITKKFIKNHDFLEKFNFCDFNFSAFLEVYTCACPTSCYSYWVKKSNNEFDFVAIFQKMSTRDFFVRRTYDIRNFSMLKKQNFLNCDFWPRKCSKWPNLVPGALKSLFWAQRKILKIFDFWT